ncbi:MAG: hypothetical protein JXR52_04555 [Bacteroidales bacterium]|nr:hypothetical protein [Bacteroidales bacterium]
MFIKRFISTCLTIILATSAIAPLSAQISRLPKPAGSGESVYLWSDRTLYCVSESILFNALCLTPEQIRDSEWSTVLYVELLKWDGTRLDQLKVPVINGHADGHLEVPGNIHSGTYYLRAYTKWMRNYSPYEYAYLPVKIINPASPLFDKGPEKDESGTLRMIRPLVKPAGDIVLSELKESYGKREPVDVEISLSDKRVSGNYCLSVTLDDGSGAPGNSFIFASPRRYMDAGLLQFLPETDGLTLTGRVIDDHTGRAVENLKVHLSSVSGPFYFFTATSDTEGTFLFMLPMLAGDHEFHLTTEPGRAGDNEILIDNDFCNKPLILPYQPFYLTEAEESSAREISINAQLNLKFSAGDSSLQKKTARYSAFYGKPDRVIYEKDFIELIDLREFFFELVPEVTVNVSDRKPYLSINGKTSLEFYPPLILMDNIPVNNDETLLGISCRNIERVEVINRGYVLGEYKYSGIISIHSLKMDLAGMKLPVKSHFFSFRLFHEPYISFTGYPEGTGSPRIADRRNLLAWQPDLRLSGEQPLPVSFYTSDAPGRYMVTVTGFDRESNTVIYLRKSFTVQ